MQEGRRHRDLNFTTLSRQISLFNLEAWQAKTEQAVNTKPEQWALLL